MQSVGERASEAVVGEVASGPVVAAHGAAEPPAKSRSRSRLLLVLLGFATLGVLVYEVNTEDLFARFVALGWRAPLLLWPYCLVALVDGWAYSFTLPRDGVARPRL